MSKSQTREDYDHEPIRTADLDGLSKTTAAKIAGELSLTAVRSITKTDDGEFKVKLNVDGGFTAFGSARSPYAIKSVLGQGNPDTVSVWVVKRRV